MKKAVLFFMIACMLLICVGCAASEPERHPAEELLAQECAVREALAAAELPVTAQSICVTEAAPSDAEYLLSRKEASVSGPFVKVCGELNSNPIAAFFALVDQGLYESDGTLVESVFEYLDYYTEHDLMCELAERPGPALIKAYRSRCDEAELIRDVLTMSGQLEERCGIETLILEQMEELRSAGVRESEDEAVSYVYCICSNDFMADVLCVYVHHDEEEPLITDVEFQLLTLYYYTYRNGANYNEHSYDPEFSAAAQLFSLIDAVEKNLTGTSVFHQQAVLYYKTMNGGNVDIPTEYTIGDYRITLRQQYFDSTALGMRGDGIGYERAVLTTYRIRK